jgi:transposase-like protein
MESRSTRVDILQQLFATATPAQKAAFLEWAKSLSKNDAKSISKVESATTFDAHLTDRKGEAVCPYCGSTHILKNGHKNGRQRFVCKDCGKTFGMTHDTILHKTKKELAVWTLYVNCMMDRMPLRKTARICHIRLSTAFVWRHKILDALTNMMESVKLDGIVECDETYELVSFKGNHKNSKTFKMPRKAHKRGGKASRRGLSNEQVCITCGVNLNGMSVGRISNLGKPSCKDLSGVLDGHVASGSIFVTDSHRGYCKLADSYKVSHIRIPRKHHVANGFNIQMVNYYHSVLKGMINYHFKGVATKYLNNYVVWHNLVNFAKGSAEEKENTMRDFVFTTKCVSLWSKNLERAAIPVKVA